jgi:hypothetical protein
MLNVSQRLKCRDTTAPTGDKNAETRQVNFVAIDMNIYFMVSILEFSYMSLPT